MAWGKYFDFPYEGKFSLEPFFKPNQNPEITTRQHRIYTNFFEKFARTFAFFPVTRIRNPTEIVQKNLFRWTFLFWEDLIGWFFLFWTEQSLYRNVVWDFSWFFCQRRPESSLSLSSLFCYQENLEVTKDFLSLPNPENPWRKQRKTKITNPTKEIPPKKQRNYSYSPENGHFYKDPFWKYLFFSDPEAW